MAWRDELAFSRYWRAYQAGMIGIVQSVAPLLRYLYPAVASNPDARLFLSVVPMPVDKRRLCSAVGERSRCF